MYVQSIKSGTDYKDLEKSIAILISDYELESLKEIEKYVSKWNLREENYGNLILTDAIEIYIIELPKFEKYIMDQKAVEAAGFDKGLETGRKQ